MVTLNSDSLLILKTGNGVAINSASGLAAESEDISDLPEGTRASGPGQGWPMGRAVRKYQAFKDYFFWNKIEQPKVGPQGGRHGCLESPEPESAKRGGSPSGERGGPTFRKAPL